MEKIEIDGCPTHFTRRPRYRNREDLDLGDIYKCDRCGWEFETFLELAGTKEKYDTMKWHEDHCPGIEMAKDFSTALGNALNSPTYGADAAGRRRRDG